MDAKTLEALKASIAKWERNAEATDTEQVLLGLTACPLCLVFHSHYGGPNCDGCPINDAGHWRCNGTPYEDAEVAFDDWHADGAPDEFRKASRDEVAFLKSLLPEVQP